MLSPVAIDMGMPHPHPTFAYLVSKIREAFPRFAYLHIVEPRVAGVNDRTPRIGESLGFLRAIWKGPKSEENGSVFMVAGGYAAKDALRVAEETGDLIAFGRFYISNVSWMPQIHRAIERGNKLTASAFVARPSR